MSKGDRNGKLSQTNETGSTLTYLSKTMKKTLQIRHGIIALLCMMLAIPTALAQKAGNTDCWGTSNEAQQGSFSTGYYYEFSTEGTNVHFTIKLLDEDRTGFGPTEIWRFNPTQVPFANMSPVGDVNTTKTWEYTVPDMTDGTTLEFQVKFAYAGGMSVTKSLFYTVGTVCDEVTDPMIEASVNSLTVNPTGTFTVSGYNLTEAIAISSDNPEFSVNPESIAADAGANQNVTVTYTGNSYEAQSAAITLSSDGADPVIINVTGTKPKPAISATTELAIDPAGEFNVTASNLLDDITITSSSENISVEPATIAKDNNGLTGWYGVPVTVTFSGVPGATEEGTITLSSQDADDVVINVHASVPDLEIVPSTYAVNASPTAIFTVTGVSLSEQITLESSSENIVVDPATLEANSVNAQVTVTYNGEDGTKETGTITLKSAGAEDVTITVNAIKFGEELPIDDFEGDESTIGMWHTESDETTQTEIIDNPYSEGINTSAKVLKGGRAAGSAPWAGPILKPITFGNDRSEMGGTYIPANTFLYMHMMVYRETDGGELKVKFNDAAGGDIAPTSESLPLATGKWQDLVFAVPAEVDIQMIFVEAGWGNITEDLVIYIDNIEFNNDPTPIRIEDTEAPTNFTASLVEENIGSISLKMSAEDNEGLLVYTVEYGEGQTKQFSGNSGEEVVGVINGLNPSTDYTFKVSATDVQGNAAANNPIVIVARTADDTSTECEGVILANAYDPSSAYKPEFEYSLTSLQEGDGFRVQLTVTFFEPVNGFNVSFGTMVNGVVAATLVDGTTYQASWINGGNVPFEMGATAQWYAYFPYAGGVAQFAPKTYTVGNCMDPIPTITVSTDEAVCDPVTMTASFTVSSENLTKDINISIDDENNFAVLTPESGTIPMNEAEQPVEIMYIGIDEQASATVTLSSEGAANKQVVIVYDATATSVDETASTASVWAADGGIYVTSSNNAEVAIYDFAGNMVQQASVDGKAFFNVDKGLYIVSIDGNSLKVSAK